MSDELPVVTLARIEGKLDLLHAAIQSAESRGLDHEARMRDLEKRRPDLGDLPARIAALEERPAGVTPARLLSSAVGVGSLCASVGAVVALLAR